MSDLRAERNELALQVERLKADNENYDRLLTRAGLQCDALQQRLTAADERAGVLEGLLRRWCSEAGRVFRLLKCDTDDALKPAEVLQIAGFKVVEDPSIPPGQISMCNCNQGRLGCTCKPSAYDGFDNGVD